MAANVARWGPRIMPSVRASLAGMNRAWSADARAALRHPTLKYLPLISSVTDLYRPDDEHWFAAEARSAEAARLYWVRPDLTALTITAAAALDEWVPEQVMPASHGIVIYEGSEWLHAWDSMPPELARQHPYGPLTPPTIHVEGLWWSVHGKRMYVRLLSRLLPYDLTGLAIVNAEFAAAPIYQTVAFEVPYRKPHRRADYDLGSGRPDVITLLGATWIVADSPGVAEKSSLAEEEEAAQAHRPPARRARRRPEHDDVALIGLRATARQTGTGAGRRRGAEHDHRWMVGAETGGFLRNQPYGKNRALRKKIWVEPYIAGPRDKPLRVPKKVYIVR
jgi:hypothetical protein